MRTPQILIALAAVLALASIAAPSEACINGVRVNLDRETQALSKAQKALRTGKLDRAISYAEGSMNRLDETKPSKQVFALKQKATQIRALATVRKQTHADGVPLVQLEQAIGHIKRAYEAQPNNATLESAWAEARTVHAHSRPDALASLEALASKDLIASPFAWKTLAALRAEGGDEAGAKDAIARCKRTTRVPSICVAVAKTFDPKAASATPVSKPTPRAKPAPRPRSGAKSKAKVKSKS